MSSNVADLPADTLDSYLDTPVESAADAQPAEELQASTDGIDAAQSGSEGEQVAPDALAEQQADPETTDAAAAVPTEAAAPSGPNWDSPENPYLQDAQFAQNIRQLAAQKQAEHDENQRRDLWAKGLLAIPDADEADQPDLTGSLIDDIQQHAIAPVLEQKRNVEHGMIALVAALESEVDADVLARIKSKAGEYRDLGRTPEEVEHAHTIRQQERTRVASLKADYETKIKNLTAQLAAKVITEGGGNRAETTTHGQGVEPELTWESLLGN